LTLALAQGRRTVQGTCGESRAINVTLHSATGQLVAARDKLASGRTPWTVHLHAPRDEDVGPQPGDRLSVQTGSTRIEVAVPPLGIRFDRAAGTVSGKSAHDSDLSIEVGAGGSRRHSSTRTSQAGSYSLCVSPAAALVGRTPMTVTRATPWPSQVIG
jgi:hypothetical protein